MQVQSDPVDGLELLASLGAHFASVHDGDGAVSAALRLPQYLRGGAPPRRPGR
ncbi:MAG: hypothetical protein ACRDS0_10915 [Pseudonocardiaceae bacterium]